MEPQLYTYEKMLLYLLRASINQETVQTTFFQSVTEEDWRLCFKLACSQQVMALAWDGICTLPNNLLPPLSIKLSWHLLVIEIEKRYKRHCEAITNLSEIYARNGIKTLLIKGVGLSTYYPKPEHREGGDIDIYTYSADSSTMSNEEAHKLANKIIINMHNKVEKKNDKHSVFLYKGIPIENHKTFLDITEWNYAANIEHLLHKIIQPVPIQLLNQKCDFYYNSIPRSEIEKSFLKTYQSYILPTSNILIPSDEFNTLYLAAHTLLHYCVGLNLHHMCDWCCLLKHNNGLTISPSVQSNARYMKVLIIFTAFTNKYLGSNVKIKNYDLYEKNHQNLVNDMFIEMFRSPYNAKHQSTQPWSVITFRIKRFIHNKLIMKKLIGEPIMSNILRIIYNRIKTSYKNFLYTID